VEIGELCNDDDDESAAIKLCLLLSLRTLATVSQSVSQSVVVIHFLWNLHGPQRAYAHYSTYARLFLFHFQRAL